MHSPLLNRLFSNIAIDPSAERAQYLQLADGILRLIKQGKLRPEQKLPGSRELATLLNLNRITINRALDELQIQGWLESFVGKGTFVSAHIPEHEPVALRPNNVRNAGKKAGFDIPARDYLDRAPTIITTKLHLDDGFPDPRLAPLQELYRAYRSQLNRSGLYHTFGSYSQPDGPLYYKTALSNFLNESRGLKTTARNMLSVRGTVMGLNLVCNGLLAPGDIVVSGIPGWGRAERNFAHAGAQHIGIAVDEHGLVVDELRKLCKRKKIRMVYVTPHHHYPTTVPLRIDRRLELLQLSYEYGFIIFEDDYDFDFHYRNRPLLPLASADEQGMVIYCGSFSKNFSPGFRMGYLAASENVIEHLSKVRILLDRQGDHMLDMAMGELLNDGTIQRYLRKTLSVYRERRDHCCTLLSSQLADAVGFQVPEGGLTVWTTFAPPISLDKLSRNALQKGLYIANGSAHQYPNYQTNSLRLGFASSTPEEMAASIEILKQLI